MKYSVDITESDGQIDSTAMITFQISCASMGFWGEILCEFRFRGVFIANDFYRLAEVKNDSFKFLTNN